MAVGKQDSHPDCFTTLTCRSDPEARALLGALAAELVNVEWLTGTERARL